VEVIGLYNMVEFSMIRIYITFHIHNDDYLVCIKCLSCI
jgi:hypothetical protein